MGLKQSKQELQKIEYTGKSDSTIHYNITANDLSTMISTKNIEMFNEYGRIQGICEILKIDQIKGITDDSYKQRIEQFGQNKYPEPVIVPFWKIYIKTFSDKSLIILIIAAVISLILAFVIPSSFDSCVENNDEINLNWLEGLFILIAVFGVSFFGSMSDYSKQKKFIELSIVEKDVQIKVIRNGNDKTTSIFNIVVGDIINLDVGDILPADGIFLNGFDLRIDESDMTGESVPVKKSENNFYMMSGCKVTDGNGKMIVVAVGPNSLWGKTKESINKNKPRPTPLQECLDKMAVKIGYFGMVCGGIVFIILSIYFIVSQVTHDPVLKENKEVGIKKGCIKCNIFKSDPRYNNECEDYQFQWNSLTVLVDYFIVAVTIIVVAVPEGLPLAVTISLAYSMKQMFKDNNLVRHLKACETMSNCTNICSDKTGTLTENRMTVVNGWFGGVMMQTRKSSLELNSTYEELIHNNIAINSSPSTSIHDNESGLCTVIGNITEGALLLFSKERCVNYKTIRMKNAHNIYQMFAFSSLKKRMDTLVWLDKPHSIRMYSKGAPEIILDTCNRYMKSDATITLLTEDVLSLIHASLMEWEKSGLRTLALSCKELVPCNSNDLNQKYSEIDTSDSILLCLLAIEDPLRLEVKDAVSLCQQAGITVRMVTGDNLVTAQSIAKQCNIITSDKDIEIEGPKFANLTDEDIIDKLPFLKVIARCSPLDKERLVKILIDQGEIVAVTGDGTNDVPALKQADIGLSMGIRGTDVAKQASDIVILDDNFNSIVNSVIWGRCVYDNIRKFLQFQLTVNISALSFCIIGSVVIGKSPLNALQMLWINLIMDTMAALALGTEKPTKSLLDRKPYGRHDSLISQYMIRNIIAQTIYQLIILLPLLFAGKYISFLNAPCGFIRTIGRSEGSDFSDLCYLPNGITFKSINDVTHDTIILQTLIFNTFVLCQLFNEFNSRKVNGEHNIFNNLFSNYIFFTIILITIFVQFIIVQFLGVIFGGIPFSPSSNNYGLSWHAWLLSLLLSIGTLIVGQITIYIPIKNNIQSKNEQKESKKCNIFNWTILRNKFKSIFKKEKDNNYGLLNETNNINRIDFENEFEIII